MRGLFPCCAFGLTVAGFLAGNGGVCFGMGALVFAIVTTVGLSFNFVTVIDAEHREVRRTTTGFWGVPGNERVYKFEEFSRVEFHGDESPFQIRLRRGWRRVELTNGKEDLRDEGEALASMMGIDFLDLTHR